jgi:MoaA/NifB/PqqE/SkfB family radical SAM enzyme
MSVLKIPFRRQYFRMARRAIVEGKLAWLAKTGMKTLAVPLSAQLGRPLTGPIMANIIPTYRCNNECFMCDLPKPWLYEKRGQRESTTEEFKALIDDFAALGTVGLSLAGGEPTMRADCFELLAHASKVGLFAHLNTNGYNMHQQSRVEELLDTGLESMNFSLDGATAETHNRLRGVPFGFERIEKGTDLILRLRRGERPSVTYTFVLSPDNAREVPAFVEMARSRGVNSVSFNPLHDCYQGAQRPTPEQLRELDEAVDWLRNEKAKDDSEFIDNSDTYLGLFPRAFRAEKSPLKCHVSYHHVAVDCYGNIYPCTMMYQTGRAAGNIRETPLRQWWGSRGWQKSRDELAACRDCVWNCHTEINLLYQRVTAQSA